MSRTGLVPRAEAPSRCGRIVRPRLPFRRDTERLVTGAGRFVGNLKLPGMLEMAVLRSAHASANIARVDATAARAIPGVVDVITWETISGVPGPIPLYVPSPHLQARTPYPLARDRVRHVGEPIAAVLAVDRGVADDALEAIAVEYIVDRAVTTTQEALEAGAPLVHSDIGTNLAARVSGRVGDPDRAFAAANHVVRIALRLGRQSPQPLEPRGVVATWDSAQRQLTVWDSTQSAHMVRRILAYLLQLPEESIRVIVGDVGGGFGGKNRLYPEEFLVAFLSMRHGQPVRWLAYRNEDLKVMYQEREQFQKGELALAADGTILGLRASIVEDAGAYTPFGLVTAHMTVMNAVGPYRIPNYEYAYQVVYTNKPGLAPYRGAGRPQGTFLIERLLERAAREAGLAPADLRLRNLITAHEQPYDTGLLRDGRRLIYDGGDYPAAYRRALDMIGYGAFSAEQAVVRREGRYLGVGTAVAIEVASTNTAEGAHVTVDRSGRVTVYTGTCNAGQGLEGVLAEVCASRLSVDPDAVTVVMGDTVHMPVGGGTWASRSAVTAGNAVAMAADAVRNRALRLAAAFLEVGPGDLELADGSVRVRESPQRAIPIGVLAEATTYPNLGATLRWPPDRPFPWGDEPGLQATAFFRPDFTYSYGAHAAVVEVDSETGSIKIDRYVVVHDCGVPLSPANVEGQIIGAVVQGMGEALWAEVRFDEYGQCETSTLMDYALPRAAHAPTIMLDHLQTPGHNPLGVKGAGEGGIIPVPAVICAAVDDALSHLGIFCDHIPLTPPRLQRLIEEASVADRFPNNRADEPGEDDDRRRAD